jgi:8-amino-3,8-dideoxy-alpha-D-manno-octulosonate transaminase
MPGFEIFGDEERKQVKEVLETGVLFRYGFDQARRAAGRPTATSSSRSFIDSDTCSATTSRNSKLLATPCLP